MKVRLGIGLGFKYSQLYWDIVEIRVIQTMWICRVERGKVMTTSYG